MLHSFEITLGALGFMMAMGGGKVGFTKADESEEFTTPWACTMLWMKTPTKSIIATRK